MLRPIASSLLKQKKTAQVKIQKKHIETGWNENYLLKTLGF